MKKFYVVLINLSFVFMSFAQDIQIQKNDELGNWLTIKNASNLSADRILTSLSEYFELDNSNNFILKRSTTDHIGYTHFRYEQYINEHKVEGAFLYIYFPPEGEVKVNGRLLGNIAAKQALISENQALMKAKEYVGAEEFYWEMPEMEALIKRIKKDENATYFPKGELVYADKEYSQNPSNYRLSWKFEINANARGEKQRSFIFVDAQSGEVTHSLSGIHSDATEGTAVTRYHGIQTIIADSTGASDEDFILYDDTRGGGIQTWDLNESEEYQDAVNFTDEDNYWDNANDEHDDAAGDTHWGMEMVYDYFLLNHNRDSYDDNGTAMVSYIHYGSNYFNAFWNGSFMTFGDGANNPLTSIDVVGHEFAHGVTGNSAGLIYYKESGALNESFSDIFGTAVEFYALPDTADWIIGVASFSLRNMADPNDYSDPDTYLGDYWVTGESDNGGVHTNSSVQNKWFYLLSEGGSGVTDFGEAYDVEGIGRIKAEAIAYRNLTEKLGPSSQYNDARIGAVEAAVELYGSCSFEVEQTIKAWHAVGLGYPGFTKDMNVTEVVVPDRSCELSDSETMEVLYTYNYLGCDINLEIGDIINFGYVDGNGESIAEEYVVEEELESGDQFSFIFDQNLDLSAEGNHPIKVWVTITGDSIPSNDTLLVDVLHQVELKEDYIIGFEDYTVSLDSLRIERARFSEAKISPSAESTGSRGFKFTGFNDYIIDTLDIDIEDYNWENNIDWPDDESDNFNTDPEYISKLCFCVDASEIDYAWLAFDLKQLHSEFWFEYFGEDRPELVSSLRILVDDEQIGDQYHPTTYDDDPFITHYVDLTEFSNSTFELCFQSKNFIRFAEDPVPGSKGDNSYLDNVRILDNQSLSVDEIVSAELNLFPNPSQGLVFVDLSSISGNNILEVYNSLGKLVYFKNVAEAGLIELNLSTMEKGMYMIKVNSAQFNASRKFILD